MKEKKFNELGLSSKVEKMIERLGFQAPSKIQSEVIPFIMNGYDVIGQAQTGTGKTLAYAASILSKIDVRDSVVKAIVLTPTRELALQVCEEFESLNQSSKMDVLAVFGGSSIELQIRALKHGIDIVVGTPGRVMDLISRGVLKMDHLEFFVLDEADEMLNMGFLEDIETIFEKTNEDKQVLLFSATMPKTIKTLAERYMKKDYQHVMIEESSKTSINVQQFYYLVSEKMRCEAMCRVIDMRSPKCGIIFCQTKKEVDQLVSQMQLRNYSVEAMHGDITQTMRIQTLERFKAKSFQFLIATDVAARGIHVDDIDCVINYKLPQDIESYVHRIGRTGRANKKGVAISLVTPKELSFLSDIERFAKCEITKCELPQFEEVLKGKYVKILEEVNELISKKEHEAAIMYVRDMNKDELMRFSAGLIQLLLRKEIGADFDQEIVIKETYRPKRQKGYTRAFLTVGKLDGLKKGSLLDFMKEKTGLDKDCFTHIEVLNQYTFVDVKSEVFDSFKRKVHNQKFKGKTVRVEKAKK